MWSNLKWSSLCNVIRIRSYRVPKYPLSEENNFPESWAPNEFGDSLINSINERINALIKIARSAVSTSPCGVCNHHRRQDSNATSIPAGKSGPSAQDRYCARDLEGGAKKRRGHGTRIETSLVIVIFMFHVSRLTSVVSCKLFWNWSCAICISRGLIWQMVCYLILS